MVTPGYFKDPDLTQRAFDDEGYYCAGDVVSFVDEHDPNEGLVFRGRIAEDFKLTSGTFVHVAALRSALLSATSVLSDAVITGENREFVGAIVWLNMAEIHTVTTTITDSDGQALVSPELREHLGGTLRALNAGKGSAARIARLVIAAEPPSLDTGEMTDKGYINQRAVLKNRENLVARVHLALRDDYVIVPA
jgi:feruloyl-CoA synthase